MFVMFHGLAPASCMECFLSMFCDSSSPLKSCFFYRFSERNSNTLHHHLFLFLAVLRANDFFTNKTGNLNKLIDGVIRIL